MACLYGENVPARGNASNTVITTNMIADKIAQAKQEKQKKRFNLMVIICAAAVIGALLLYLLTNFKVASDEKAAQSKLTQQTLSVQDAKAIDNADNGSDLRDEAPQDSLVARQTYLAAYQHYQTALKPPLNDIDLARWDKSVSDKLQLFEETALEQFSTGNYASAMTAMTTLTELANATLERSQKEVDNAIARVKQAYFALDTNMAKLALDKITLHQKDHQELGSLSSQVDKIPTIRALEDTIRIANIENEPEKELQAIRSLAKVDSDWAEHSQRAATLASQLTTKRFNQAIARAYVAVDKKQINTARSELNKARAISSSRNEINQLSQAIAQIERTNRFETNVASADNAATADDWDKVSRHITQALSHAPNDGLLTRRLDKANQIIALKKRMAALLENPYRLANESVKIRAQIALIKAEPYADDSASLNALSAKLAGMLAAVNKVVAVSIASDGMTSVSIRGVGIVGAVASKVIQLKPGPYTFEGKRNGYKSKIVTVTIPMNAMSFKLTVVADERI